MFIRLLRRRCGSAGGAIGGAGSVGGGGEGGVGEDVLSYHVSVTLHMKIIKYTFYFF